jgi:hypothetical protein
MNLDTKFSSKPEECLAELKEICSFLENIQEYKKTDFINLSRNLMIALRNKDQSVELYAILCIVKLFRFVPDVPFSAKEQVVYFIFFLFFIIIR